MKLYEFLAKFPTEESIIEHFIQIRYKTGICCPHCGCNKVYHRHTLPKKFKCSECNNDFSIFTNTIFEKSSTDLRKWFLAIHFMMNDKKGISALQLQREIDVTYKTAWRMLKQIRSAMGNTENEKIFTAIVEIDETYVGGKPRKQAKEKSDKDDKNKRGRGTSKTPVIGLKERNSNKVYAKVALPNKAGKKLTGKQLLKIIEQVCKDKTTVISDEFRSYGILDKKDSNFFHLVVNHSLGEYSRNGIHTNGIESFWALLKRGIYGMYHQVSEKYLQFYVNEFCFRLNNRKNENSFDTLLGCCVLA